MMASHIRCLAYEIVAGWAQSAIDCGALDPDNPECTLRRMMPPDVSDYDVYRVQKWVKKIVAQLDSHR